jgi:hypothetical protein
VAGVYTEAGWETAADRSRRLSVAATTVAMTKITAKPSDRRVGCLIYTLILPLPNLCRTVTDKTGVYAQNASMSDGMLRQLTGEYFARRGI